MSVFVKIDIASSSKQVYNGFVGNYLLSAAARRQNERITLSANSTSFSRGAPDTANLQRFEYNTGVVSLINSSLATTLLRARVPDGEDIYLHANLMS